MKKTLKKLMVALLAIVIMLECAMVSFAEWKKDEIGVWWEEPDGYYPRAEEGEEYSPVYLPDPEFGIGLYYFDSQGYLARNTTLHFESHFLNDVRTWDIRVGKDGKIVGYGTRRRERLPEPLGDTDIANGMLNPLYKDLLGRDSIYVESILGAPVKITNGESIERHYADGSIIYYRAGVADDIETPIGNLLHFTSDSCKPEEITELLGWDFFQREWGGIPGSSDYLYWSTANGTQEYSLILFGTPNIPSVITPDLSCRLSVWVAMEFMYY